MRNNPFLSETFKTTWLKHFNCGRRVFFFSIISKLAFVKNKFLPIYYSIGKTNTKGISYNLSDVITNDYKGKMYIVYDVPTHTKVSSKSNQPRLGTSKIIQYPGFRCVLQKYNSLNDYMLDVISSKSRYKFRSYKKKIENSFGSCYKVYFGEIDDHEYEIIFAHFKFLLRKRFFNKKTINNNLTSKEWQFYKEVTLPMIRNKEAALFVIFDNDKPIAVTLTNFSENVMFDVIRVFDIDYSKYRLGIVGIMKQLEWCIEHGLEALDFSKGFFEYKKRWSNQIYWFEYHIYYDKKSFVPCVLALSYNRFYNFKLFLRRNDLINFVHKILFLRNKKNM